ncbi:hypothetical protein AAG747_10505 [Rapidithrix thailandica]|uniref:Uncharacterized protein n=1 Tax=Rapidithrix thailandica TaxID=413964 RepID=A0AAW9S7A9_9BACT
MHIPDKSYKLVLSSSMESRELEFMDVSMDQIGKSILAMVQRGKQIYQKTRRPVKVILYSSANGEYKRFSSWNFGVKQK